MTDVQWLIQGGAVGISLALIVLIFKIIQNCNKNSQQIVNVVENNARILQKLSDNIDQNTKVTEQSSNVLKSAVDMHSMMFTKNGKQSKRMEEVRKELNISSM